MSDPLWCNDPNCFDLVGHAPRKKPVPKGALVVASVVVYAVGVLAYALAAAPAPAPYPFIEVESRDGGESFTVVAVEDGLVWEDFVPFGCNRRPNGSIEVGDNVTGCAGSVALQYTGWDTQ